MKRHHALAAVTVAFALLVIPASLSNCFDAFAATPSLRRPNIVFILADDYGIDEVGCYGSDRFKHKTPNLDALAAGGVRFEYCFATPLCGPTRCLINTGRYGFRTGGLTNDSAGVPSSTAEPSLARILKQAGYATGTTGKWRQMGETPKDWGFDESITDFRSKSESKYWTRGYTRNGQELTFDHEVYYPDEGRKFAIDFFTRHRDEPFYFYFAERLLHAPIEPTPDSKSGLGPFEAYDATVEYLDKQVGKLVGALERLGLLENTLIVFAGDNGTSRNANPSNVTGTIGGRAINGRKGEMLEGGARVPLIASCKGLVPSGRVIDDLIDFSDLLPTFAELANAKLPSEFQFDGRSFAPQLRGEPGVPREWVFVQLGNEWYVRRKDWKLNQAGKLFSMRDAPFNEKLLEDTELSDEAITARRKLQAALGMLNPAGGKTEENMTPKARDKKPKKPKKAKNVKA